MTIRILTVFLLCVCLSSCLTSKLKKQQQQTESLLEQINPATGKHYTPKEIKKIKAIDQDQNWMDQLLSPVILIIFSVTAVLFVAAGAFAFSKAKINTAIACWISAGGIIALPIVTIILYKALMFLLYIFCGLVVLAVILGLWWLYSKHKKESERQKRIAGKAMATVEEVKSAFPDDWKAVRQSIDRHIHDDESREAVKEFKKQ